MHDENEQGGGEEHGHCGHCEHMDGSMRKDFKIAMLEKKEKMLKAKLEYLGTIKALVAKMPENEDKE